MVKVFHTGDIHLDSAFHKLGYDERIAARQHQRDIFEKMIKYVADNRFDVLLISGDLFDGRNISPETEECVKKGFESVGCRVFISPGNHDPYALTPPYFRGTLPDNVCVFNSAEIQVQQLDELGIQVCGYAFMTSNVYANDPLSDFSLPSFDGASILCAHGELNVPNSRIAPISDKAIDEKGFTYAALGHVHTAEISKVGESTVAYCGVLEGRAFDELGDCGGIEVLIDGKEVVSAKTVLLGEKKFVRDMIDIGECQEASALAGYLENILKSRGYDENTAVRLTLEGEIDLGYTFDKNTLEAALSKKFMLCEIIDRTCPRIDTRALEGDYTLRGEIYRVLRDEINGADGEERRKALEALKVALFAIEGRSIR